MSKTEIYRLALSTYGAEAQTLMMMEEMAMLHDCAGLVEGYKAQKLERLEKRLREG